MKALDKPGARERLAATNRVRQANPTEAERERRRAHGRWLVREVLTPARLAKSQRPEIRQAVGRANTDRLLGWCPPERRDEYRRLRRSQRYSAVEARAVIEADLRRISAAPAAPRAPRSFEEQLAAVAGGAKLVPAFQVRRADPSMTLGGIASALL